MLRRWERRWHRRRACGRGADLTEVPTLGRRGHPVPPSLFSVGDWACDWPLAAAHVRTAEDHAEARGWQVHSCAAWIHGGLWCTLFRVRALVLCAGKVAEGFGGVTS